MQPDGELIRRQREERGYGLRRFAKAARINPGYLSRIEHNERNPQPEVMARIAILLGMTVAEIARRDQTRSSNDGDHGIAVHDDGGARGSHP